MQNIIILILWAIASVFNSGDTAGDMVARIVKKQLGSDVARVEASVRKDNVAFLSKGKIASINVVMYDLKVNPAVLKRCEVTVKDLKLAFGGFNMKPKISRIGDVIWNLDITEAELQKLLQDKADKIRNIKLQCHNDYAWVSGKYNAGFLNIPFKVKTKIIVQEKTKLYLDLQQAGVGGFNLPSQLREYLEREVNPVIDFADVYKQNPEQVKEIETELHRKINFKLDKLNIKPGAIYAAGSA